MRKIEHHVVAEKNRDEGKRYEIKELPASQAEAWAFRAFQALARTGVDIPENVQSAGMAGLAVLGFKALAAIPYHEAKDLMDEMMSCVRICRDKNLPDTSFALLEEDIEEVATRVDLRKKVFELHTGFSFAEFEQKRKSTSAAKTAKTADDSSTTPTSTG